MLATAYWAYDAAADGARWRARSAAATAPSTTSGCASAIAAAFNRAYVGEDGCIEGDTQTAYLLALHMDLLAGRAARARRGAPGREHRARTTAT